eukprot:TRINITY_DN448_c0_g1_i6.p1 TRINITY_DN448_c0_g1~~TRINITY_DN448_c0_g1_i6.p1  ORF type:complete len:555 (+),score=228.24 TRINITY_DN448_c0_g1_i6:3191-4855(+)
MNYPVAGLGNVAISLEDQKTVGYDIQVTSEANLARRPIEQGEAIAMGTEFEFNLRLSNHAESDIRSGAFKVLFTVRDSSGVAIHSEQQDRNGNDNEIAFQYTLKDVTIPSGNVDFVFQIASDKGVHSTSTTSYPISLPMVATKIIFSGFSRSEAAEFKLGESVKVTMVPATTADLRNVQPYSESTMNDRNFVMDIKTFGGKTLATVPGVASSDEGSAMYSFEHKILPNLDMIGANLISFRYLTAAKDSLDLQSYDSFYGELFEDTTTLNFTVDANLVISDITKEPTSVNVVYGTRLDFEFKVKDTLSNLGVNNGESSAVQIGLQHAIQGNRLFTSLSKAAEARGDGFAASWVIDPNAVRGKGFLAITAKNPDGVDLPLLRQGSNKVVKYEVDIGGNIDVVSQTYSTASQESSKTIFAVEFDLFCNGQKLEDARLFVDVSLNDQVMMTAVPVLVNDTGSYQVTWGMDHKDAPSGDYQLNFYREADRQQALEMSRGNSAKKSARNDANLNLTPIITLIVPHQTARSVDQIIRSHTIAILALGALSFFVMQQKKNIQ